MFVFSFAVVLGRPLQTLGIRCFNFMTIGLIYSSSTVFPSEYTVFINAKIN